VPEDIEDSPIDLAVASTVTSRTGAFTFPAVPVGHYLVQVVKGLVPSWSATVRTASGGSFLLVDTFAERDGIFTSINTWWASEPVSVGRADVDNLAIRLLPSLRFAGRADFEGMAAKPSPAGLGQIPIVVEPASVALRLPTVSSRFRGNGQFDVYGLPAGRYVLRIGPVPRGWSVRSATYNGHDILDVPFDLAADMPTVVVTFTDRPTEVSGTVRRTTGTGDADATVLIFPSDPQVWAAWGEDPRRFKSARVSPAGVFKISALPPGTYYIVAIPEEQSSDWQDAALLEALTRVASPLTLSVGDSKTLELRRQEVR
jgi:hypothetical protein